MARFRLRFLLQEFDLVGQEILLGRSPECHITLEDPLVSRTHARIVIEGEAARISDLGSRNGVRINGRTITGEAPLNDGDRIRLGTQELVFSVVKQRARAARPTGFMRVCSSCGTPYPEGAPQCPHCGSMEEDDDTISGLMVEPARSWTFQLLGEVIERAIAAGRAAEAARLMSRAQKEVDDRIAAGDRLDRAQVEAVTSFALRLAALLDSDEWVVWAMAVHRSQSLMPSSDFLDQLEHTDWRDVPGMPRAIASFVQWWQENHASDAASDAGHLERLKKLTR